MVRGVYINRAPSERMTVQEALDRYEKDITSTKKTFTQRAEEGRVKQLKKFFGKYSLAAVTPDLVATYRDDRLAEGKANNTVRLELALLSHLFTTAIQEWRLGLVYNPVANIRKPNAGVGRNRRLTEDEEKRLVDAADKHSNPMFGWLVRLALYTGMRSNELLTLTRSQIDLKRRIVRLDDTKNGSSRTVPLSLEATEIFRQALQHPIRPKGTELVNRPQFTRHF